MIMEAIFGGDMYPLENIVPQQDGYKAEVKAIADLMDELANRFQKLTFQSGGASSANDDYSAVRKHRAFYVRTVHRIATYERSL